MLDMKLFNSNHYLFYSNIPIFFRTFSCLSFEESRKGGLLFKAKGVGNLSNVQATVLEQAYSLLNDATSNDVGGGLARYLLHHPIKVVDMNGESLRIICCRPHLQYFVRIVGWELAI